MKVELRTGNPVEVLVQLGRTADLLVVGARGRRGFRLLLTGSVAVPPHETGASVPAA
ncbi:MAG TPA: universal stress protein [Streptosporangiaceae bacterium]|nr:universal stress protein [Streptosporangiaceae bacterium]